MSSKFSAVEDFDDLGEVSADEVAGAAGADAGKVAAGDLGDVLANLSPENKLEIEKILITRINAATESELIYFLETELYQSENRHMLSEEVIKALFEKCFSLTEKKNEEEDGTEQFDDLLMALDSGIQLHGDFARGGEEAESITDRAFRVFQSLITKYPKSTTAFWKIFGQDGQTVRPDIFIEGVSDMVWRPDVPDYIKTDMYHTVNYLFSFFGRQYEKAIVDSLDFKNPENYFRTGAFLEFVRGLHGLSGDFSFSEKSSAELMRLIGEVIEKNEGSYLLNLRARKVYEDMESGESSYSSESQTPFLLTDGVFAISTQEKIFVSRREDEKKVKDLFERKKKFDEDILEKANNGLSYLSPEEESEFRAMGKEMRELFNPELAAQDLVIGYRDKTEDEKEKGKQDIYDFSYLLSLPIRRIVEDEFGVDMSKLSLSEQFYFLQFIKKKEAGEVEPVKQFAGEFGEAGLRSFLACAEDPKYAEVILSLGEKLGPEAAKLVFSKYSEIAEAADTAKDYVLKNFGDAKESDVGEITRGILRSANELLLKYNAAGARLDIETIESELEEAKQDVIVFTSSFKILSQERNKNYDFWDLNDIKDIRFTTERGAELTPEEVKIMRDIYRRNYKDSPKELIDSLIDGFDESIADPKTEFWVLRHNGKPVAFYRLDDLGDNRAEKPEEVQSVKHFASFNVDSKYKGSRLAETMMEQQLDRESGIIRAECLADKPISMNYIERGFVAVGMEEGAGLNILHIEKNAFRVKQYGGKKLSTKEIVAAGKDISSDKPKIYDKQGRALYVRSAARQEDFPFEDFFASGLVMTRYFKEGDRYYAVFEEQAGEAPFGAIII